LVKQWNFAKYIPDVVNTIFRSFLPLRDKNSRKTIHTFIRYRNKKLFSRNIALKREGKGKVALKVCMFVYNNMTHDSRVMKEAKTLAQAGHDVRVIAVLDNTIIP